MRLAPVLFLLGFLLLWLAGPSSLSGQPSLLTVLKDKHAEGADHWVYNNLTAAREAARKLNRPLFVTFRCVPCKACSGFDAEVAKGSEIVSALAKASFVSLRQVEMKGVDLSQFQFDYDLNWAAMFLNADGTVYGRYGTQSAEGPDAYNSVASLEKAMLRVLKLHAAYPGNAAELAGKLGPKKPYQTALDMPELEDKEKRRGATARNNCIHCHNIHDAEYEHARKTGAFTRELLWRYPLPDNIGLQIDRQDGCKIEKLIPDSPAARAGLQPGDILTHANGQVITSIADLQWVLHHLPNQPATIRLRATRGAASATYEIQPGSGWKQTDFTWRGSRWALKPRPGFWAPFAKAAELSSAGLPEDSQAYRIQWINTGQAEGRAAKQAGLKEGDLVVEINGKPVTLTPERFHMHVRLNYQVGEKLPLTIVRARQRQSIDLPLVE